MGRLDFPRGTRLYFDTAPFIYSVEENPVYWRLCQHVWNQTDDGASSIVTSELSLLETLVVPIREKQDELLTAYETLLTGFRVELTPISLSILRTAAELRAHHNLKTPDAIHAATAISSGCDYLIANDNTFRRLDGLEVIILSDLL